MSDFKWGNLRAKVKRTVGMNKPSAIVGDENGNIYDPYLPGYVLVRTVYANGYGKAFPVLGPAGTSIQLNPGTRVKLGQTDDNKLQIVGYDIVGGTIDGVNLLSPNVPSLSSGGFIGQQSIITALVTPQAIPDLTVSIKAWVIVSRGLYYEFPGLANLDLSGSVPSAGNNCYAVIFIDNDFVSTRITSSTPRSIADLPLAAADIQECVSAAPITSTPLAAIRLYGGQTTIQNSDIAHDLRQMINTSDTLLPVRAVVRVVTAAGAVTVTTSDYLVVVKKSVGAATVVNLPASPSVGDTYVIKDGKGDAAINNITLTPAAGNIDGAATYVLTVNYQSATVTYNGSEWSIV